MYIVVIEWNGLKVPTSWYNFLKKLGIAQVRGSFSAASPVAGRADMDERGAVIAQEGAILCGSRSLANQLADEASKQGAGMVLVGTIDIENYDMTPEDLSVVNRIYNTMHRRGRPVAGETEDQDWAVTCYECGTGGKVNNMRRVLNCPNCKGFKLYAVPGDHDKFALPQGLNPEDHPRIELWIRYRFPRGRYQQTKILITDNGETERGDYKAPPDLDDINLSIMSEFDVIDTIRNSPQIEQVVQNMFPRNAIDFLDDLFLSRCYALKQQRDSARVDVVTAALTAGVDPKKVSLVEKNSVYDIVDAAHMHGTQATLNLITTHI
jgi:hypothetical protein